MPKIQYLELLWTIAANDFKLRYYGSYLGYIWTLLKPLALFGVMFVVFSVYMNVQIPHYQLYLLLGILLWSFFAEGTMAGVYALSSKIGIIKKIYFPRSIVVLSSTLSSFIGLLFNLIIFFIFFFFSGVQLTWHGLLFLPLILLLYLFVVGVSLFLTGVYIKLRDIGHLWEVALQVGFWLTPILYTLSMVPTWIHSYLFFNPMTGFIQYARLLLIEHQLPSLFGAGMLCLVSLATFTIGFLVFRRLEPLAAQEL